MSTDDEMATAEPTTTRPKSISERLKERDIKRYIKFNIGVFLAVGVGYGLSLFLFTQFAPAGDAGMGDDLAAVGAAAGLIFWMFLAPLIATITGIITDIRLNRSAKNTALASGVGSAIGFLVMFFTLFVMVSVLASGDGGGSGTGSGLNNLLLPLFGFAIGVGATGAMAAYVSGSVSDW